MCLGPQLASAEHLNFVAEEMDSLMHDCGGYPRLYLNNLAMHMTTKEFQVGVVAAFGGGVAQQSSCDAKSKFVASLEEKVCVISEIIFLAAGAVVEQAKKQGTSPRRHAACASGKEPTSLSALLARFWQKLTAPCQLHGRSSKAIGACSDSPSESNTVQSSASGL